MSDMEIIAPARRIREPERKGARYHVLGTRVFEKGLEYL